MFARRYPFPTDARRQAGRQRCRAARRCNRGWYLPDILAQSSRPAWGGARQRGRREASAEAPFSSRWVRIFSITTGSSMQAMILTAPPHSRQVSMSILNTRLRRPLQGPTFGVPSSSMLAARRRFALGLRRRLWACYPCLVWRASPPHDACCSVRIRHGNGSMQISA